MTEDIDDDDRQLTAILDKLRTHLSAPDGEKKSYEELSELMERAMTYYRSMRTELVELPVEQRQIYNQKISGHKRVIDDINCHMKWLKPTATVTAALNHVPSTRDVINATKKTTDDSVESLSRSKRIVEDTKIIGASVANALKEQTEILTGVNTDVDKIESNLGMADKQIRAFVRRMMTDKIILAFLCLIVIGIIVMGIVMYVKQH